MKNNIPFFLLLCLFQLTNNSIGSAQETTKNHVNASFGGSQALGVFANANSGNRNAGYATYWMAYTVGYQRELIEKHLIGTLQLNYFSNYFNNKEFESQLNPNTDKSKGNVYGSSTPYVSKFLMLGIGTGIVNKKGFKLISSLKIGYGLFQNASFNFNYSDGFSSVSSQMWVDNEYTPMFGGTLDARFAIYKRLTFNVVIDYYMADVKQSSFNTKVDYESGFNNPPPFITSGSFTRKVRVINPTFGFGYNF